MGATFTCGRDAIPDVTRPCYLISLSAPLLPPPSLCQVCCVGPFLLSEVRPVAGAPRNERDSPEFPTFRRPACCSTNESLHSFADGSSGCQGTSSLSSLFVCLRLLRTAGSAERAGVLLTGYPRDELLDVSLFPHSQAPPEFCVSVCTFGNFSQEQS